MSTIQHKNLTDPKIHEPKGASTATSGQVYVANGSGSGVWTTNSVVNLTDTSVNSPQINQTLVFNGTNWVNDNVAVSIAGIGDTATMATPYTDILNGTTLTIAEGTSASPATTKAANVVIEKWINQDYDTGSGNRWDRGGLYAAVRKTAGDSYSAAGTFYTLHTGGEGHMVACHNRAFASHANAKVFGTWSYIQSSNHAAAVGEEINVNNDRSSDPGWSSGGLANGYAGGQIISTADSCATPITWYTYYAAQKFSGSITSTGIAFVSGTPATITISSGFTAAFPSGATHIRISGSSANSKIVAVDSITDTTITLASGETLTNESAGPSITLERWACRGAYTGILFKEDAFEKESSGNGEIMRLQGATQSEYAYKGIRFEKGDFTTGIELQDATFARDAIQLAKGQTIGWGGSDSVAASQSLEVDSDDNVVLTGTKGFVLPPLSSAPSNPVQGMIAYDDGTDWGGSGEGVYVYNGSTWSKL